MNRFKQHFKKYQHVYIAAGAFAAGVFVVLSARKQFVPAEQFDELDYYQLGGEKSPLKVALTASDANAYNRVAADIMNGAIEQHGESYVLKPQIGTPSDMKVYNRVAGLTNDYIEKHTDGGIPLEQIDDSRFYLEKLDRNQFVEPKWTTDTDKKEEIDE